MTLLYGKDVWPILEDAWCSGPRKCAVAYWTHERLAFEEGDTLVVDASDEAIAGGLTKASVLRTAVGAGAAVYHWPCLHAKVYVLGAACFVGSANATDNSAKLMECVVYSLDALAVSDAVSFVTTLAETATPIDENFLRRIEDIAVTARDWASAASKSVKKREPRYWLVGREDRDPGEAEDEYVAKKEAHQERLGDTAVAEWFTWSKPRSKFHQELAAGDVIVEIWNSVPNGTDPGDVWIYCPSVIQASELNADGDRIAYQVSRADYDDHKLSWEEFLELLQNAGWNVTPTIAGSREIPRRYAERINRLWPELHD